MQSILLGTGAAEGIPAVFCVCPVCQRARERGGREIRTRSSMLLDGETMIDFSPDLFMQMTLNRLNLNGLQRIFLTHFHEDHYNVAEMGARMCAVPRLTGEVEIVCSAPCADEMRVLFSRLTDHNREKPFDYFQYYRFSCPEAFETRVYGDYSVTPLLSSHQSYGVGEIAYNYLFEKAGRRFLYASDTGWYPGETWAYLKGKQIASIVMEATYGDQPLPPRAPGHLNFTNALDMLDTMRSLGCIDEKTPVYLTHMNHLSQTPPDALSARFKDCGFMVTPGFDGMPLDIF